MKFRAIGVINNKNLVLHERVEHNFRYGDLNVCKEVKNSGGLINIILSILVVFQEVV